jgi:hypothetical protein
MLVLLVFPFGIEKQFNLFGPTCFAFSNNPPPPRKEGERERGGIFTISLLLVGTQLLWCSALLNLELG